MINMTVKSLLSYNLFSGKGVPSSRLPELRVKRVLSVIAGTVAIATGVWCTPGLALDPFRTTNPHQIDEQTEAAFRAIFERGDYVTAQRHLQADTNEPLNFAMRASLAYMDQDWDQLALNARQTRETAERLVAVNPLRGHLYTAVGHFLEGAHVLVTQGTVRGTPTALSKLQQVFENLNAAERISRTDPELNLLQGYMDLMLAVNLPFSNPRQAIARLENYASPSYIVQRGLAVAYRDLRQPEKALEAVNKALVETPDNPDLLYLKAQILVRQGREPESLDWFRQALEKEAQLPQTLANQIAWEQCRTTNRVQNTNQDCAPLLTRL